MSFFAITLTYFATKLLTAIGIPPPPDDLKRTGIIKLYARTGTHKF
jgi:hypothetical protein